MCLVRHPELVWNHSLVKSRPTRQMALDIRFRPRTFAKTPPAGEQSPLNSFSKGFLRY